MLERFRLVAGEGKFGYVLVASASFMESVDFPGDTSQLVVIDKLPFPSPGDPLVQARSQRLMEQGRSPFTNYFLPKASIALQQGAGRQIRRESDCGILVMGDARLANKGYGRRILATRPPMRRMNDLAAYHEALEALTRASTKVARAA